MNQQKREAGRESYFMESELKERERLNTLFENYFKHRGCTDLETTPVGSYRRYDALMTSGKTVFMEMKARLGITSLKYSDNFIEKGKFLELYSKWKEGYATLFITEYKCGWVFMWDLTNQFRMYDSGYSADGFFVETEMTADNFYYSQGSTDKLVRYLPYHEATYIVNSEYEPCSYKQYFEWRKIATDAIVKGIIKNPDL
jgi:hypothetical protein